MLFKKVADSTCRSDSLSDLRVQIHEKIFKKYDHLVDSNEQGPTWLSNPKIADIVKEALHYRDKDKYDLYAYCIMPNHVHLVCKLPDSESMNLAESEEYPLTSVLKSLKWYTALKANKVLNRTGSAFWQSESYDHVIRDSDEMEQVIHYTLNNPVKAGLVTSWEDWSGSYCKNEFRELF